MCVSDQEGGVRYNRTDGSGETNKTVNCVCATFPGQGGATGGGEVMVVYNKQVSDATLESKTVTHDGDTHWRRLVGVWRVLGRLHTCAC